MNELTPFVEKEIQRKLKLAARHLEDALALAQGLGWPDAVGFISGEGSRVTLSVIDSHTSRMAQDSSMKKFSACADGWDCGAW